MIREKMNVSREILVLVHVIALFLALILVSFVTSKTAMASLSGSSKEYEDKLIFSVKKITYQVTKTATIKAKGTVSVIGLQSGYNPSSLTIPSTITYRNYNYTVNAVGDNEYEIDEDYFLGLPGNNWGTKLTKVTLPSTIKTIYGYAFGKCETLSEIKIPNSVTMIGAYAFDGCRSLKEVTIPSKVKNINIGTFGECTSLKKITLSKNLVSIGEAAFYNCWRLEAVSIPAATTSISEAVFSGCTSLDSLKVDPANKNYKVINNSLLSKDGKTLYACPGGNDSYSVPEGVTTIAAWAFENSEFHSVKLANTVTSIESNAFYASYFLKEVIFGSSVKTIGDFAFYKCCDLESITLPASVRKIGEMAFMGISSLKEVSLNEGLKTIDDGAFQECIKLETVTIPASVEVVGVNIFADCKRLSNIIVAAGNTAYKAENRMLLTSDGTTLISYPTVSGSFTIPSTIAYIGDYAFYGTALTDIVIPATVKVVGIGAFSGCTSLKNVRFMSRDVELSLDHRDLNYYYLNKIFQNASDNLVITIPKDPLAPLEPIREQYTSENEYNDAYYEYTMYLDDFLMQLLFNTNGKTSIVYE